MYKIEQDDKEVGEAARRLIALGASLRPLMQEAGECLADSTMRRFATSTAPDGSKWAPNRPITLERFLGKYKGSHKKDGSLSKAGAQRAASKKPLVGETRQLSTTIHYTAAPTEVDVGSGRKQAAVMQWGAKARSFAGHKSPWGDIPGRAFLGLSKEDGQVLVEMARDYVEDVTEGRSP